MERFGNFERRSDNRESENAGGIESLRSQEGLREYLRTPENRTELTNYFNYLGHLLSFVDTLPRAQQLGALRTLDAAISRPFYTPAAEDDPQDSTDTIAQPTVSPTVKLPTRGTIPAGQHMDVTIGVAARACWPDRNQHALTLTDGIIVTPRTPIGIIDFYRNIKTLTRDDNLVRFSRELIASATESLRLVAQKSREFQDHPSAPEAFSGMSHLARLARRFGFTVFDIVDDHERSSATGTSFRIANGIAIDNSEWRRLRENYKPAQVAIISTPELIKRYSQV